MAMEKHPKKQRLSVYLEPDVMKSLATHAARRGHSLSLVAEAGIASFLSPDAAERQEAAIAKRLDQLDRRMTRMERDLGIAVETLAIFVRFWLSTTRSEEHTSELQSLMRISYAVFCLKKKKKTITSL